MGKDKKKLHTPYKNLTSNVGYHLWFPCSPVQRSYSLVENSILRNIKKKKTTKISARKR